MNETIEYRHYIIGKAYEQERNLHKTDGTLREALKRRGREFGYAVSSLKRFYIYAMAVDRLKETVPDIVPDIFAGNLRLSMDNVILLSKMTIPEIRAALEKLSEKNTRIYEVFPKHSEKMRKLREKLLTREEPHTSIKNMPKHDPDAQISGLAYTIPSWVSAIDRVFMDSDFCEISKLSRDKLITVLYDLKSIVDAMVMLISEE
ncbi:hypothetical protein FACS189490_07120 [Clostridia bacterium]|nr:hypothetical protein FACS189490_07120 [Clostridia bacterium]